MNARIAIATLAALLAVPALPSSAQQRVDFQRQKFDRSRFDRPGETAAPAPAPVPAALPEPASFSAPAPMATSTYSSPTGTVIFSADSTLPSSPPPQATAYFPGITPEEKAAMDAPLFDQLPSKEFNNAKEHEELLALQKKTGACMIVYFKNFAVPNEKGLCNWFEKTVTTDIKWRKAMKYYLRLEINVPGNSAVEELVARYRAPKTPAVFVVKPGSTMPMRVKLFDYPANARPVPIEASVVLESIKAASTPAYQALF